MPAKNTGHPEVSITNPTEGESACPARGGEGAFFFLTVPGKLRLNTDNMGTH